MKKVGYLAVFVSALLLLGACGDDDTIPPESSDNGHNLYVESVEHQGREFLCIVYDDKDYEQGGLWCQEDAADGGDEYR